MTNRLALETSPYLLQHAHNPVAAAVRNADFVLGAMRADGRLLRTWKDGQV